jgi:hypothetical protein
MKSFRDLQLPILPMEGDEDDDAAPTALQFLDYLQRKQEGTIEGEKQYPLLFFLSARPPSFRSFPIIWP